MYIERVKLSNFRCFGPTPETIDLSPDITAFVGTNGAGKTAVMQGLLRLFGVTYEQRHIRRQDFHIRQDETVPPDERSLFIEVILAFPELDGDDPMANVTIPEFFKHMVADDNGHLKCRLHLKATWINDGSLEGSIEQKFWAVKTLEGDFDEETDCQEVRANNRGRIQIIYVPAIRDGISQISAFLRGRLWKAITWSAELRERLGKTGEELNEKFRAEPGVDSISRTIKERWQEIHSAGTDAKPLFRPIDLQLEEFIKKVDVVFRPDESGRDRNMEDLSDGQRSLFHLAMAAATLDIEDKIASGAVKDGFQTDDIVLPALTLIAIEEPENNLAPFYLSRIIRQIEDVTNGSRAQALIASHSASILTRIDPKMVRHFQLIEKKRESRVKKINLPDDENGAAKFVREAVRAYPEMYFAKFVILGEGSSEEVVIPRLAEAMNMNIDRSFVAVVPLGGRHVNHLWRLLSDLNIPYATLLDLDIGRAGGGWDRIKTICSELIKNGASPEEVFGEELLSEGLEASLKSFAGRKIDDSLDKWVKHLRKFGVFFCSPLDIDWAMLTAFPKEYQELESGGRGPNMTVDAKPAVLGDVGEATYYGDVADDTFNWYRYLFLGRSKPSTHLRVLSDLDNEVISENIPEELAALINHLNTNIYPETAEVIAELT